MAASSPRLAIDFISAFGLPPAAFGELAAELGEERGRSAEVR